MFRVAAAVLGMALLAGWTLAQPEQIRDVQEKDAELAPAATARLVSATRQIVPGMSTLIGVEFRIKPGWHLYWDGLNDSGFAPKIDLHLPAGFSKRDTMWPAPKRHVTGGMIIDHIYENRVILVIPINAPADLEPGSTVRITADLEWLECADFCIGQTSSVTITLPVVAIGSPPAPSSTEPMIREAVRSVPQPPERAKKKLQVQLKEDRLLLFAPGARQMTFFPSRTCRLPTDLITDGMTKGDRMSIRLDGPINGNDQIKGVVELIYGETKLRGSVKYVTVDIPQSAAKEMK